MVKFSDYKEVCVLFGISLLVFTFGLAGQEVIGFESRFYLFALEMYRHGLTWFPTTYLQPYPDYPGSSTWLIYLTACIFGGLNKLTAVLPTAVASALVVVLTYLIGALHQKRWGLIAALFLFLTIGFLKSARSLSLDMYPALMTVWCFYLVHAASVQHRPQLIKWVFLLFFLGFAFRGPIGLVMPTGVVCVYYLLKRDIKHCVLVGFAALSLLILSTAGLLLLAKHVGGVGFVSDVIRMEVVGRIDNSYQPIYFYLTNGLMQYALSFPLALFVMLGVFDSLVRSSSGKLAERQFLIYLIGWMLVILLGMTIPGDKKIRYVLPMVPAAALLAAYVFVAPSDRSYFTTIRTMLLRCFFFLPAFFALAAEAIFYYATKQHFLVAIDYHAVCIVMVLLQIAVLMSYRYQKQRSQVLQLTVMGLAVISFIAFFLMVIEPIEQRIERARAVIVNVEAERIRQHAQLVFYKERPDGFAIKYLINMPQEEKPLFIESEEALLQMAAPAYFVTSKTYFDALPRSIAERFIVVFAGDMAHSHFVVFTQR
jgi:4-amino-4-deoxy-L-arabinose transferase-like glycosyltransferase